MKLSEGASTTATTTVRDVACEMRSFFFLRPSSFPFFFSSSLLRFASASGSLCASVARLPEPLRDNVSTFLVRWYYPTCPSPSAASRCVRRTTSSESPPIARSLARSRLCRDGERANIRFSRLPAFPSPSPLFDFLVWVCFRFSFDFALSHTMFTFAWILQPSTPFPFFPISSLPFLFHSVTYPVTYKSKFWFYDNPTEIQLNLKD